MNTTAIFGVVIFGLCWAAENFRLQPAPVARAGIVAVLFTLSFYAMTSLPGGM